MTYLLSPEHRITAAILTPEQLNQSLRIACEVLMCHNMGVSLSAAGDKQFFQLWHDRKDNFFFEELKQYFTALSSEWTARISDDVHMQKYMSKGVMKNTPKEQNISHPAVAQFSRSMQRLRSDKVIRQAAEWPAEVFISHQSKVLRDDYSNTHLKFLVNNLPIPTMWQLTPFYHGTPRVKLVNKEG